MKEWISYNGEGCPVSPETEVIVKLRDAELTCYPIEASYFDWSSTDSYCDIIAYKIVKPLKNLLER